MPDRQHSPLTIALAICASLCTASCGVRDQVDYRLTPAILRAYIADTVEAQPVLGNKNLTASQTEFLYGLWIRLQKHDLHHSLADIYESDVGRAVPDEIVSYIVNERHLMRSSEVTDPNGAEAEMGESVDSRHVNYAMLALPGIVVVNRASEGPVADNVWWEIISSWVQLVLCSDEYLVSLKALECYWRLYPTISRDHDLQEQYLRKRDSLYLAWAAQLARELIVISSVAGQYAGGTNDEEYFKRVERLALELALASLSCAWRYDHIDEVIEYCDRLAQSHVMNGDYLLPSVLSHVGDLRAVLMAEMLNRQGANGDGRQGHMATFDSAE